MNKRFRALVRDMDQESLEELRHSVVTEMEGRRQKGAIKLEDIHPRMTPEEKQRAMEEIARALKGGGDA